MKCSECLKELNEMTLYCDRCGAQVAKEKMKLSFEDVERNVVPLTIESTFKLDQVDEIKKAYFLSNIKQDFKGYKRRYINQYIDYVLLRVYYEKNKVLLTTSEFDIKKALAILETFELRKPTSTVFEILKEEYGEDYEIKVIPRSITDQIKNVYCTNFNLRLLSPSRFGFKILFTTIVGIIRVSIFFAIIGALLLYVAPMFIPSFDFATIFKSLPYNYYMIGGLVIVIGYVSSRKQRKYYPFEDIINSNSVFKKHIKTDIKKRIKTLRYRIKKEGKTKK